MKLIDNRVAELSTDPTKKFCIDVLNELRQSINQINDQEEEEDEDDYYNDYYERTKRFEHQSFINDMLELFQHSLTESYKTTFTDYLYNNSKVGASA